MTSIPDSNERLFKIRATSFNVLDFGAISVMLSARYSYNSSVTLKVFTGNPGVIWCCIIVAVLQILLTYIPGLNTFVFSMKGMDGLGWGLTIASMVIVFGVMEVEKAIRRSLKAKGADTDDRIEPFFTDGVTAVHGNEIMKMPKGASKLNLQELAH